MRLTKYTEGWTRRHFLEQSARGIMAAGVLAPLWETIGNTGTCEAAYPPELRSIEAYTKGKLKAGQELNESNVDIVKDILDPAAYWAIKHDGRVVDLQDTTTKVDLLTPPPFLHAGLHNKGKFHIGSDGNVWTKDHKPWTGGIAFPDPKTPLEIMYTNSLSWGKHDSEMGTYHEWDTDPDGRVQYQYQSFYVEYQTVGRLVNKPKPYLPGHLNQLRYFPLYISTPEDQNGTAFLQVWSYDQRKFPKFYAYTPLLKRVKSFPTNQRFEPQLPGETDFASDVWMAGDPLLTWGDFKTVGKGPVLAAVSGNSRVENKDWLLKTVGGKTGKKYFRTTFQLVPEAYICELKPTHYPRAPIGKKRIWYDARTINPLTMISYDRSMKPWQQWEGGFDTFKKTPNAVGWNSSLPPHHFWSWTYVHALDMQSGRMTRFQLVPEIVGGFRTGINQNRYLNEYCSMDALRRLGR